MRGLLDSFISEKDILSMELVSETGFYNKSTFSEDK